MEILIRDARFWVALLLLIRSVLFYVVPAFPEQIWVAIDTFVGVVLGILAGNNVVQTRRAAAVGRRQLLRAAGREVVSRSAEGHRWPGLLLWVGDVSTGDSCTVTGGRVLGVQHPSVVPQPHRLEDCDWGIQPGRGMIPQFCRGDP